MMTKNSKISRNEQVKQEIFLTAKRPSFTTDANGVVIGATVLNGGSGYVLTPIIALPANTVSTA